jgi:broad specificity phosphatase PhoE
MAKLYLIRHGESLWNLEKKAQGHLDSPLTELGIKQSRQLAEYLKDKNISKIYSSDLNRALDTARIISSILNIPLEKSKDLREINLGIWEGRKGEEIKREDEELYNSWFSNPSKTKIPKGESIESFQKRIVPALYRIINKHRGEKVAIVSHGGVIITFIAFILNVQIDNIYWKIELSNGSISEIEFFEDNYFKIKSINNTSYLNPH